MSTICSRFTTYVRESGRAATVLEYLLYAGWAVALVWPGSFRFDSRVIAEGDGEFYMWLGWRMGQLLSHAESPLFIPDIGYPEGYHVGLGDGVGPYIVLGAANVFTSPAVALNATIVGALFLNAVAGRHLARVTGASHRLTWIVTALALASAPSIVMRASVHFHFLFAFVATFLVAEGVRFARESMPIRTFRVGTLLGAAFYVSFYWFLSALVAFGVIVGVAALRERSSVRTVGRLVAALVVAGLLIAPIAVPRASFSAKELEAGGADNSQVREFRSYTQVFSADVLAIATPTQSSRFIPAEITKLQHSFTGNPYEANIFPGFIMLIALVGLAFTGGRLRLPVLLAATTLWILALGPALHVCGRTLVSGNDEPLEIMPEVLLRHLPAMEALRTPSRIAFALPILAAVALAVVADRIISSTTLYGWRRAALASLAVILLLSNLVRPVTSESDLSPGLSGPFRKIAREAHATDAVVEVPFDPSQSVETIRFQMVHHRPTLGFHGQWAALPWFSGFERYKSSVALAELRCLPGRLAYVKTQFPNTLSPTGDELSALRREFGIRYLLVNDRRLALRECARREKIETIVSDARLIAQSDGWRIFEIDAT